MHLLAIDLGTTSVKATLFDQAVRVVESVHQRVRTRTAAGGEAEQTAEDWLRIVIKETARMAERFPQQVADIGGIAVTGHMMGCLPVDSTGKPLAGHMLHSDTRSRDQSELLREQIGSDAFYRMTGNVLNGASMLPKMLWLKANSPALYQQTDYFLNAKDFITGFLTGDYGHSDYSDASHAGIIDIRSRQYPIDLFRTLGLDPAKMPQLHAGTDRVGSLCPAAAQVMKLKSGIPVVAGAGDGACSAIGAGAGSPGDVYCCMGTTAWIACLASEPVLDMKQRSFNIISGDGRSVGSYGTIQNCGRSTDFAMRFFDVEHMREFDELAAKAPAGSDGLIYLPYLDGERGPVYDPDTQGVLFGLDTRHGREHGLRSILEGVALALRHNADVHRENAQPIDRIRLIGGGARSDIWRNILASALPAAIIRMDVPPEDATTLGAALLAGTGVGLFESLDEGMATIRTVGETVPDSQWQAVYEDLYNVYVQLYPALKSTFHMAANYKKRSFS